MAKTRTTKISGKQYVQMSRMGWHFNICERCGYRFVIRSHDFDCPKCPLENKRYPFIIQIVLWLILIILIIPAMLIEFIDFIKLLFRRK